MDVEVAGGRGRRWSGKWQMASGVGVGGGKKGDDVRRERAG